MYRFNAVLIKTLASFFFLEIDKVTPNFTWKQSRIAKTTVKKNKLEANTT